MMEKITSLTPAQLDAIPKHNDTWLDIGLSVEPTDRDKSRDAVAAVYTAAGLTPPKTVIFLGGPLQGCCAAALLASDSGQFRDMVQTSVGAIVWEQIKDEVKAPIGAFLGDKVEDQLVMSAETQLLDRLSHSVLIPIKAQVAAPIGRQIWGQLVNQIRSYLWTMGNDNTRSFAPRGAVFGSHNAGWLAYYSYFKDHLGMENFSDRLDGLRLLAGTSGWMWAFENLAIVTDRPSLISRDSENRLHSETGPALTFPDGSAIHVWHGTRVPSDWIEVPESIQPADVLGHQDGNMRAAGIQIFGWERFISKLGAKVIDRHPEGMSGGELLAVKKSVIQPRTPGVMKLLHAQCPRNGSICFRVPDDIMTAHEAQAWSRGLSPELFKLPAVRT